MAECVAAMSAAVSIPVTVKMRIGVVEASGREAQRAIAQFTERRRRSAAGVSSRGVRAAGATAVIVHARKAVLGGLSPKENREVPPLRYDVVRAAQAAQFPLPVILNGGLREAAGGA